MTPYYTTSQPAVYYDSIPLETSGCFGSGGIYREPAPSAPIAPLAEPRPATPPAVIDAGLSRASFAQSASDRATVVVRLPADATLFAEGRPLQLTGPEREFVTPRLSPGEYGYTFKVEYRRGGETLTRSRVVAVRPGERVSVDFVEAQTVANPTPPTTPPVPPPSAFGPNSTKAEPATKPALASTTKPITPTEKPTEKPTEAPAAKPAGQPARIVVKLPPGATLSVDGRKQDRPESVRQFETPPIPPGETFTYTLQVNWPGGGAIQTQAEKVTVRAGAERTVDFTNWTRLGG